MIATKSLRVIAAAIFACLSGCSKLTPSRNIEEYLCEGRIENFYFAYDKKSRMLYELSEDGQSINGRPSVAWETDRDDKDRLIINISRLDVNKNIFKNSFPRYPDSKFPPDWGFNYAFNIRTEKFFFDVDMRSAYVREHGNKSGIDGRSSFLCGQINLPFDDTSESFENYLNKFYNNPVNGVKRTFSHLDECKSVISRKDMARRFYCKNGFITTVSPMGTKICAIGGENSEGEIKYTIHLKIFPNNPTHLNGDTNLDISDVNDYGCRYKD